MPPKRHLGLEAALEEERLEILGLLDQDRRRNSGPPSTTQRNRQSATVTAPVRSLFDVSPGALPPRHGSIAGIGVGVTPPSTLGSRVFNEPLPASSPLRLSSSAGSSSSQPLESDESEAPRRSSEGSDQISRDRKNLVDQNVQSRGRQSGRSASIDQTSVKRAAQPQEKPPSKAVQNKSGMSGLDLRVGLPSFARGRDSGRRSSTRGTSLDSRSPVGRSSSPKNRLNTNNQPAKLITDRGKLVEMETAHKNVSDVSLPKSTGSPSLPKSTSRHTSSEVDAASQDERLEKDMYDSENNPIDTSEDENESTSSDDDAGSGNERGRKPSITDERKEKVSGPRTLLEAAEEERLIVAKKLEPNYTYTSPSEPKAPTTTKTAPPKPAKKPDVHPRTSYEPMSTVNTPFGSDDEAELSDIKKAQKMGIQMSSINTSVKNRAIRTIIRGDYSGMQEESEGGRRRPRKYLVATDLSEESTYALEWTIGTILRDGDTMFAVCAYEEFAAGSSVQIGEGAKAMQDAAAVVGSQTEETVKSQSDLSLHLPRALFGRFGMGSDSKPSSVDARGMTKAESERARACNTISETCVGLLRKTGLQVRIAIEVIHCKSPKHMITEAIDGLEPTLVIVGARGRSALKGVLLGSFSNYLVTNSSVPVMVARRRLKKQTKNRTNNVRFSNNLLTPKKLAQAKVD